MPHLIHNLSRLSLRALQYITKTSTIICALAALLVFEYARPIGFVLYAKWKYRNAPQMWVVPSRLLTVAVEPNAGRRFSYFGYDFDSPWTKVERERKFESGAVLNFSGGQFISILNPAQSGDQLQIMKQEATKRGVDLKNVFGEEATRSKYALDSKIWNLTPGNLQLFSSRQEMVSNSVLLIMKDIFLLKHKGGLYTFETPWFRGFQVGGPAQDDMVIIDAFDASDRKIAIYIGSKHDANPRPSQADINGILSSLRPSR